MLQHTCQAISSRAKSPIESGIDVVDGVCWLTTRELAGGDRDPPGRADDPFVVGAVVVDVPWAEAANRTDPSRTAGRLRRRFRSPVGHRAGRALRGGTRDPCQGQTHGMPPPGARTRSCRITDGFIEAGVGNARQGTAIGRCSSRGYLSGRSPAEQIGCASIDCVQVAVVPFRGEASHVEGATVGLFVPIVSLSRKTRSP